MSRLRLPSAAATDAPHSTSGPSRPPLQKKSRRSRRQSIPSSPTSDENPSNPTTFIITSLDDLTITHPTSAQEQMPLFPSTAPPKLIPVFVASLGNPHPYLSTLHSAGHTVLTALAKSENYTPWRPYSGGSLATGTDGSFSLLRGFSNSGGRELPTLWKCGAMMNVSGPAVKKAFAKWKKEQGGEGRLVIVHDELERELGSVHVRSEKGASARGHNGLKSVMAALPNENFVRIGVGIGRPVSRERGAVSEYVLRKMTGREGAAIEGAAREVSRAIAEVYEGEIG